MRTTFRKLLLAWPLLIFLLFPAVTRAETGFQAWVQRYNGPANGADKATAIAVDGSNNVIVTGESIDSAYYVDYVTIKYSSAGVPLWTNRYDGPANGYDRASAVAVDSNNDVIVTGASDGGESSADYATIKYSSAGVPLWTNHYNGPANTADQPSAVAVDGSNDVIVTGWSGSGSIPNYATIKYSSAGVPLWTNLYSGPRHNDSANAVAVDGSNNVIVTGYSVGSVGFVEYATIKYSSAGVPLWTNRYSGPGHSDSASAVAVDRSDNVIVTGSSYGSGNQADYATIQYSSAGVALWTNRYNGLGNSTDFPTALAVDRSGNVIVTGPSIGTNVSGNDEVYATIKYSNAGVPLWTNLYSGPGIPLNYRDWATAVAVDVSNNVIVTGYSMGSASGYDYATIKYSSAGVALWTNRYNGSANGGDSATAMAVDRSGNVIVTGYSTGSGSGNDYATVKYICVPSPVLTGLQPTNGTFQLRVDDVLRPGTLVLEASTNLAGWAPLFTNTTPTNVLFYTDPKASNYLRRFYRAFQFP